MNPRRHFLYRSILALFFLVTLSVAIGCGGGGGGGGDQGNADDVRTDEQITTLTWDQGNWDEVNWK